PAGVPVPWPPGRARLAGGSEAPFRPGRFARGHLRLAAGKGLMNAERLGAMVKKEFVQMVRDQASLRLMLLVPVMQLLIFGSAIRADVRDRPPVVFDQSRTQESRAFVQALIGTDNFAIRADVHSYAEAIAAVDAGRARAAVVLPPDYARNLKRGEPAQVQV